MKKHNFIKVEHDNGDFDAVSVTPETMAALLAFAEAAGKDPTDVLTDAVTEYLNRKEGGATYEAQL